MAIVEDNVDVFQVHPTYAVAALMPDRDAVDKVIDTLDAAGDDQGAVEVMHGAEGLRILDQRGRQHGAKAWLHRLVQSWTYYEQILGLYSEGLSRGEFLVVVPSSPQTRQRIGQFLVAQRGHGVYYFGFGTVESLTGP